MKNDERTADSLRAEAQALFQVNQAGRTAAERVGALLATGVGLLVAAGVAAKTDDVAIAFPPLALLLLSYMFQQYAEVSVTGGARRVIEDLLHHEHGDEGTLYEHLVAPVRQNPPLSFSVRVLQRVTGGLLLAATVYAALVAFDGQRWYIEVGFLVATAATAVSAWLSYRDMGRAGELTKQRVAVALGRPYPEEGHTD